LDVLILGCGYTGKRVAKRFVDRGARVTVTTRDPEAFPDLGVHVISTSDLAANVRPGMLVLHSIPPDGPPDLLNSLEPFATRIVYLSSTAVYGYTTVVNEFTPADPSTERAQVRLEAERLIAEGPWSSLILRPAAIYGPGRGVQEAIKRGTHSLSKRFVSRIHVDDLAAHAEAAMLSTLRGAYPVADEEPCTSLEIAEFCAELLGIPLRGAPHGQSRFANNRRVDGSAIRRALGITLKYPSYRVGIPASLSVSD
jgi:nucleoside-diphosphate-sugar epimerase